MRGKTRPSPVLAVVIAILPQFGVFAGEALPPRALARLGDHRFYHGPGIRCLALSPDGRRVASAALYPDSEDVLDKPHEAYDRLIVLWDAATGERLRELRVPQASVVCLTFSPDGKRLAASSSVSFTKSSVVLFDVESGKLLRQLGEFPTDACRLDFSSDGKQLRVSEWLGVVSAWDVATGKQLRLWKPPPETPPRKDRDGVSAVQGVLSPDGKTIVWEMGRVKQGLAPDKTDSLRVHDADTGQLLYQKRCQECLPWASIVFSSEGKCFAADCGGKLTVWETASGKERTVLEAKDMVRFMLAPEERRAVIEESRKGSKPTRLRLWDLESGKPLRELCASFEESPCVHSRALPLFFADGKTLLLATDSTLRLFDTTTGQERGPFGHRAPVTPRFSADGRTLFTSCAEWKCRWNISTPGKPLLHGREPRPGWEARGLAHSAADRLVLDASKGGVRVRETATGRILCDLEDAEHPEYACFSPDAAQIVLGYEGEGSFPEEARLYDARTGKKSAAIQLQQAVSHAAFLPNGKLVAWTDRSGGVHFHDAATAKALRSLRCSRPLPQELLDNAILFFSPNGEYLFEAWPTLPTRVFQVASGREVARFPANPYKPSKGYRLSSTSCSPDSRLLASGEWHTGTIRLLEIASGKVRAEFTGHRHGVHGLAFAPDGKTLASGGEDNVVFLWDVTGARTVTTKPPRDSDLPVLWKELASDDARRAGDAIACLLRKPEASVAFLKEHLRPAEAPDAKRLAQWIAALDADSFEKREAADRELTRLGEQAEPALRRALNNQPSLEAKRRIEDLLSKLEPSSPSPELLRTLRAIEVLEHIGTPAARQCLEALAKGMADARPTRQAKAALQRLTKPR